MATNCPFLLGLAEQFPSSFQWRSEAQEVRSMVTKRKNNKGVYVTYLKENEQIKREKID